MYIACNGILCLILSLVIIYMLNKLSSIYNWKWVREGKNYVGSVCFSVIFFFIITVVSLLILLYIISYDYTNDLLLLLKNSGVMLAITIAITGFCSRGAYRVILNCINRKSRDGLYPLEYSDAKWLFVFSCLIMIIVCFSADLYMYGLTIFAIIIGKFVWFDITPKQKHEEIKSLLEVPLLYFAVLFYLLLIVTYVCFFEDLIQGCMVGVVISWIISFIYYIFQHKDRN